MKNAILTSVFMFPAYVARGLAQTSGVESINSSFPKGKNIVSIALADARVGHQGFKRIANQVVRHTIAETTFTRGSLDIQSHRTMTETLNMLTTLCTAGGSQKIYDNLFMDFKKYKTPTEAELKKRG